MKSELRWFLLASVALFAMLAGLVSRTLAESPVENANLVTNPSFEQAGAASFPEGWHGDAAVYASDSQERHSGTSSLRFTNSDASRYRLCSQKVPLRPGWQCRFGVWIKTKDIRGPESGATICLPIPGIGSRSFSTSWARQIPMAGNSTAWAVEFRRCRRSA